MLGLGKFDEFNFGMDTTSLGMSILINSLYSSHPYPKIDLWELPYYQTGDEQEDGFHLPDLVEPWGYQETASGNPFDAIQASPIFHQQSCTQPKKREVKKMYIKDSSKPLSAEVPSEILCRIARKQNSQADTFADSPNYYMHSRKIIEVEYEKHPIIEPRELQSILGSRGSVSMTDDNTLFQSATLRQEDIAEYFNSLKRNACGRRKSAGRRPCTPRIPGQLQSLLDQAHFSQDPNPIPFRPKSRGSEPVLLSKTNYTSKFEVSHNPPILNRVNRSTENVVLCPPVSESMQEWRKNRAEAAISMKKLKAVFPSVKDRPLSCRSLVSNKPSPRSIDKVDKPSPAHSKALAVDPSQVFGVNTLSISKSNQNADTIAMMVLILSTALIVTLLFSN